MTLYKIVKDSLTGADNHSFLIYFSLAAGSLVLGHPWSAMDFAGGVGTMAVGFGINLKLKYQTEPAAK